MSNTVPVRIRHEFDLRAQPLTEWPLDDLNGLLRTISEWGIAHDGEVYDEAAFGQIAVTDEGAYFEVVFGAGD